jgi:hypothetical protein
VRWHCLNMTYSKFLKNTIHYYINRNKNVNL